MPGLRVQVAYSHEDMELGAEWRPLLQDLLQLSQSHITNALQALAWAVGDSSMPPGPSAAHRSDPTGATAALAVPAAAYAGALLCRQCGGESFQQQVPDVILMLTSLAEACMRAVWPLGIDSQTSTQLLALAKLVIMQASSHQLPQ